MLPEKFFEQVAEFGHRRNETGDFTVWKRLKSTGNGWMSVPICQDDQATKPPLSISSIWFKVYGLQ